MVGSAVEMSEEAEDTALNAASARKNKTNK
jgi:hypothetical protein